MEVQTEGFIDRGKERGMEQGQGDGHSLGIEQPPISHLPLFNTGITVEPGTEAQKLSLCVCISLFVPLLLVDDNIFLFTYSLPWFLLLLLIESC